jgi:hypothetical protein
VLATTAFSDPMDFVINKQKRTAGNMINYSRLLAFGRSEEDGKWHIPQSLKFIVRIRSFKKDELSGISKW